MANSRNTTRVGLRWLTCFVVTGILALGTAAAPPAWGQEPERTPGSSRVRPVDPKAAALLQAGIERSVTFRRLVETIEQSDLIVWVQAGDLRQLGLLQVGPDTPSGLLQFATNTPYGRYVRIVVRVPAVEDDLIATLAHELQHAVEVAGAPEVRDHASLLRLYQGMGYRSHRGANVEMETVAAQQARILVLKELGGRRPQAARR